MKSKKLFAIAGILVPIIYYWTSESKDEKRAYLVAYNGYILDRSKTSGPAYQGYRCIKD